MTTSTTIKVTMLEHEGSDREADGIFSCPWSLVGQKEPRTMGNLSLSS